VQREIIFTRETAQWITTNYKVASEVYLVEASDPSNIYQVKTTVDSEVEKCDSVHLSHLLAAMPETLEKVENEAKLTKLLSCSNTQEQTDLVDKDTTKTLLPLVKAGICVAVLAFAAITEESLSNVKCILDIIANGMADVSEKFGMLLFLIRA
jgi:hypothetical protein